MILQPRSAPDRVRKCCDCHEWYAITDEMQQRRGHDLYERCDECRARLSAIQDYEVSDDGPNEQTVCPYCCKGFETRGAMRIHMKAAHGIGHGSDDASWKKGALYRYGPGRDD